VSAGGARDPYRIRDWVPDFDAIQAEIADRSRALSRRARLRDGLAYGSGPRETLDVLWPDAPAAGAPLHVFVHGGYWRSGDKADTRCVAAPVLAAGGIAALVEYDLMPGARLPALVAQVRAALRWLVGQAEAFGFDPSRITASGHSAGAHLASYLAAVAPEGVAPPDIPLRSLLLVSGIYDLSEIPGSFLRDEARMTQQEARGHSPLTSHPLPGPLRVITRGGDETLPFHDQAERLHGLLVGAGLPSELRFEAGRNHLDIVLDLADPDRPLGRRLAELVAE
jgi:arylformamidase